MISEILILGHIRKLFAEMKGAFKEATANLVNILQGVPVKILVIF